MHEHLGQSIAYARSNGVTPPWSKTDYRAISDVPTERARTLSGPLSGPT